MSEFVIQTIGFAGLLFFIVSYQIRSNKALFLCQLMGCVVFCVQMLLLGAYTGAVSLLVNILRNILLLKINDWKWVKSRWTLTAVIALLTAVTAYTWNGALSLLPFVSVAVTSIGYWTDNAQKIRLSQLIGSPCTLLYDIFVKTWGGAISEGMTIVSIIVSIVRFGWNDLDDKKLA